MNVIERGFPLKSMAENPDVGRTTGTIRYLPLSPRSGPSGPTCGSKATQDCCVGDDEKARAKLATEWRTFAHADRTSCTDLTKLGGGLQSYVELLTCLEMAKEAKKLPRDAKE